MHVGNGAVTLEAGAMEGNAVLQGFALLLLLGLPLLASRDVSPGELGLEPGGRFRRQVYVSVAVSLALIAGLTLAVMAWQDVPAETLGWRVERAGEALLWAAAATVAGLAVAWAVTVGARRLGLREGDLARLLMPRTAAEKAAFLLLAGVGALCEEYVFRGFLLHGVATWTGAEWFAVAATSVSFGFAHGYQRLAGIVRASLLGAVLAIPVVWTGSLFPAVVAHFWINAAIGLGGWRLLLPESEREEISLSEGGEDE